MDGPILCAVDDSSGRSAVVEVAASLARKLGAPLVLVHAVVSEAERSSGELVLAEAAVAAQLGTDVERTVLTGSPGRAVARLAEERGASLLVVGSRGRGPLAAGLLGSVSHEILSTASCPVVVVPAQLMASR